MTNRMLGILGGMGVRSTSPFLEMVLDEIDLAWAPKSDFDYPPMTILSWPAPMILGQPLDHQAVFESVLEGCKRLRNSGATLLAMPCNTTHRYHAQLQASLDIPLLNMVTLAADSLPMQPTKVTLIGTQWTVDARIYQKALGDRGHTWIDPNPWRADIDRAILSVKNGGDLTGAKADWNALLDRIHETGVEIAILACTDLNPLHRVPHPRLTVCDATVSLAKDAVKKLGKAPSPKG